MFDVVMNLATSDWMAVPCCCGRETAVWRRMLNGCVNLCKLWKHPGKALKHQESMHYGSLFTFFQQEYVSISVWFHLMDMRYVSSLQLISLSNQKILLCYQIRLLNMLKSLLSFLILQHVGMGYWQTEILQTSVSTQGSESVKKVRKRKSERCENNQTD